ncbi:hypothetical protein GJ496_010092 [Pomphorhynchus laevis]|nr:hypothetical protein GJ496_010092 [Pomphorhynchus laevis]
MASIVGRPSNNLFCRQSSKSIALSHLDHKSIFLIAIKLLCFILTIGKAGKYAFKLQCGIQNCSASISNYTDEPLYALTRDQLQ